MLQDWTNNVIALTGSIGSGKTEVGRIFESLGVFVVRADDIAREVVSQKSQGLSRIVDYFGAQILLPSGELNRPLLGSIVFSDPQKRTKLEQITHPLIKEEAQRLFTQVISSSQVSRPLMMYDIPLLFETEQDTSNYKCIIVVYCDDGTCIKRIMARDNLSEHDAKQRLNAQLPISLKIQSADHVIDNTGSIADLKKQCMNILDKIKN